MTNLAVGSSGDSSESDCRLSISKVTADGDGLADTIEGSADSDGDGTKDTPLAFSWSSGSSSFRDIIVNAVDDIAEESLSYDGEETYFDAVEVVIVGDTEGFVTSITDGIITDVDLLSEPAERMRFKIDFDGVVPPTVEDQLFTMTLQLVGDGVHVMDTLDVDVVVPGTGG